MFYEERTGDGNVTFSDKLPPTLLNHAKMMAIESIPQRLLICKYEFVENSAIQDRYRWKKFVLEKEIVYKAFTYAPRHISFL